MGIKTLLLIFIASATAQASDLVGMKRCDQIDLNLDLNLMDYKSRQKFGGESVILLPERINAIMFREGKTQPSYPWTSNSIPSQNTVCAVSDVNGSSRELEGKIRKGRYVVIKTELDAIILRRNPAEPGESDIKITCKGYSMRSFHERSKWDPPIKVDLLKEVLGSDSDLNQERVTAVPAPSETCLKSANSDFITISPPTWGSADPQRERTVRRFLGATQ